MTLMTGETIKVLRFLLFASLLALILFCGTSDSAGSSGLSHTSEPPSSSASEPPSSSARVTITMYAVDE